MRKLALFFILMLMPILVLAQVDRERYFPAIRTDGKITAGDTLVSLKGLRINGNIRGFKGTFSDTLVTTKGIRSEGPSLLKGKVTGNDTLVAIKGLRVEGPSLLKGKVTGNDTLVAIKGLRVEGPSLLKGKVTGNDTLVATKGFRSEGPIRVKDVSTFGATATPVVISTTGDVTAAGKVVARDSVTIGKATATDQVVPYFRMKGDADSDASAVTSETFTLGFDCCYKSYQFFLERNEHSRSRIQV